MKLRQDGKDVPKWLIEAQKAPSCSLKIMDLGLPVHDEQAAIDRILKKNHMS